MLMNRSATMSAVGKSPSRAVVPWLRTWLFALAVVAVSLGSLEAFWRARGFQPNIPDSFELYAHHRSQVVGGNRKLIVAVGTSRIRTDVCAGAVAEGLPGYHFVQLGLNGAMSRVGLLAELSEIPEFCGIVLCDALPPMLDEKSWIRHKRSDGQPGPQTMQWSARFRGLLQESFVIADDQFSLRGCLHATPAARAGNRFDDTKYFRVHADRSMALQGDSERLIAKTRNARYHNNEDLFRQAPRYATLDDFADALAPLVEIVSRIHRNHGKVIFLRLPASGRELRLEESAYPSAEYFPVVERETTAPWIDFRSLPHHADFLCPDESHLSPDGAQVFTKDLVAEMKRRRIVAAQE
jgi:hypothetical protein